MGFFLFPFSNSGVYGSGQRRRGGAFLCRATPRFPLKFVPENSLVLIGGREGGFYAASAVFCLWLAILPLLSNSPGPRAGAAGGGSRGYTPSPISVLIASKGNDNKQVPRYPLQVCPIWWQISRSATDTNKPRFDGVGEGLFLLDAMLRQSSRTPGFHKIQDTFLTLVWRAANIGGSVAHSKILILSKEIFTSC